MNFNLSEFHQAFFEESLELLAEIERVLLVFDFDKKDKEPVNQLFRAIHTVKGNSAAFGFTAITEFAHVIETLMGRVRSDKYVLKQADVSLLLKSTDCLRNMVADLQNNREVDQAVSKQIVQNLNLILAEQGSAGSAVEQSKIKTIKNDLTVEGTHNWHIIFNPAENILGKNCEPYLILQMLEEFGSLEVKADLSNLPDLKNLDPEKCYVKWDLILRNSKVEAHEIKDIFEWINLASELKVIPLENEGLSVIEAVKPMVANLSVDVSPQTMPVKVAKEAVDLEKSEPVLSTIRISVDKIDDLINIVGELVITQSILDRESEQLDEKNAQPLLDGLIKLHQNCRVLQEMVMRVRMVPISFAFTRFHRMVRDLALKTGKQVELKISGEQTEIDKTMMEKLVDPLTHLVRNSIDHGLELPDKRIENGKPSAGTIELSAYQKGGHIIITVSDDGAGLNKDRILKKAREQNLITQDAILTDDDTYDLIFQPGFSTAEAITEISGRGVGMDVVRQNIEELHGTISIYSESGVRSKITLTFPLTLAIMDCQLVQVGKQIFIIPLISITEIIRIDMNNIHRLEENGEFYSLRGDYIPIINLAIRLSIDADQSDLSNKFIIVVSVNDHSYGLVVDDMLSQQQVVIKNLEDNCKVNMDISGATVLGDGSVALILDINGIVAFSQAVSEQRLKQYLADAAIFDSRIISRSLSLQKDDSQFLIFKLGENEYGINMTSVVEVQQLSRVTEIPGAAEYLKGVINLRGIIVPIMDLKVRFGFFKEKVVNSASVVIVLKVIHEQKQRMMSVLVDAVSDTCYAKDCTVSDTPDYDSSALRKYMQGILTIGNRMIAVLDAESLMKLDA